MTSKPVYKSKADLPPPPHDESDNCCCDDVEADYCVPDCSYWGPPALAYGGLPPNPYGYAYPMPYILPPPPPDFDRGWPQVAWVPVPQPFGFFPRPCM
jgi:hypothetical protein